MLMNDSRSCAMAVNAITAAPAPATKLFDREVERHERCFLFGHYDSRGGASLIPAKDLFTAFKIYSSSFGFTPDEKGELQDEGMRAHFAKGGTVLDQKQTYEEWLPNATHSLLEEDYMFSCNVVVCDKSFGEGPDDLDSRYSGKDGYRYGVLQYRFMDHEGKMTVWLNFARDAKKTLVFWKGKEKPAVNHAALKMDYLQGLETRVLRRSYGEDACGVCWMPEAV